MSNEFKVGQWVRILPHTTYGDLRGGAVHSDMHEQEHAGHERAQIEFIGKDGYAEVYVPGWGVDAVDISQLSALPDEA